MAIQKAQQISKTLLRQTLSLALLISAAYATPCARRNFGNEGFACVCNATYCDFTPPIVVLERGQYLQYTSSRDGLRLQRNENHFHKEPSSTVVLKLDNSVTYQTMQGFGGAFTDSAAIVIKSLSRGAQKNLIRSYFSEKGNKYSLGRVPIAGSDFSTRKYSYDDVSNDTHLEHFNLTEEDLAYKIPLMQEALQMNPKMRFISAAWSAPPWMKTINNYTGGYLKEEYYQLYTDYLIKFLSAYDNHGVPMWAISTGNEPNSILFAVDTVDMGWTPQAAAKWVAEYLGPTIRSSKYNATLILAFDDQRLLLQEYVSVMFKNVAARNYADGVAVHWYTDFTSNTSMLDYTHNNYPEKLLIYTEASAGYNSTTETTVPVGSWTDGESYIIDIIQNLNHWVTGWIEWNLALNQDGGPCIKRSSSQAAIIVNAGADEFYKMSTFYAIAHFSKFIPTGSLRIKIADNEIEYIKSIAFKTPNNNIVIVLYNMRNNTENVTVYDPERGNINLQLKRHSVHTIIYK